MASDLQRPAVDAAGTLDEQQNGLTTQTKVGDDGRVNITIHEINELLANEIEQLQLSRVQEGLAAPPQTAHALLESSRRPSKIPPSLNVVVQVVGSRGDVQPFVALGLVLKNQYGHRVRLATHGTFKKFVEENGLEFFDIGGDPAELMAFMVKNPGLIPGMKSIKEGDVGKRRRGMAEILEGCWRSCADFDEVKDEGNAAGAAAPKKKPFVAHAIIANPPSFAHIHCAEKLGIPLHLMFTMPWSPTREFPQPIANIKSSKASGSMTNEMSYTLVDMMTWEGLGDITNKFRKETLGLHILSQAAATDMLHRLRIPYTYCWSPALIPKPKDWGPHITVAGFYFLSLASNYRPDPTLAAFLAAGPPPVYIGFGSIVVDDPNAMTKLIFDAVKKTGQRALVSKGWGGLGGDDLGKPDNVYMLGNVPHDWLFQHVSCVVHHGGAGTTAAGIALGRPTVIVPFFGDQPFWGAMVARAGAGPTPIPSKELTADRLANAILEALKPETLERARELGERIKEENGTEVGAASFHAQMGVDRLRCLVAPSRPAVWSVKTTGSNTEDIRLSAFAATVLGNEGLLDVNQLTIYRPCEHPVEFGTISSHVVGPNPVLSTMGSITSSIVHIPINIAKAWAGVVYEPYKGARSDGWKGFGKGLGRGLGHLIFRQRGLVIGHAAYGVRALYDLIKKKLDGDPTLSYILATRYIEGFEEVNKATVEEKLEVVRRWKEMKPELKMIDSRTSIGSGHSDKAESESILSRLTSHGSTKSGKSGKSAKSGKNDKSFVTETISEASSILDSNVPATTKGGVNEARASA
ncbi:uncharacterized protein Z519_02322 [Cladophialophora bantiana CBS 173.52]|uniref:Glycosyltransferase family 28 N-terminal domain-containing protein n=1 Tax=Cladophialophora bantiana (strain ATCC 10958 / CBS 173.52 / CDC B-1940 / NIH 8579) TaxID=1442370 RepID=A0A0D2F3Y8_CLAB1|nr:uncharacterized protein Z519_02322 [Cladophialophora bantiana CBS 173.52]KIW96931.1 hypothetical protein Z519_02322 [Cladophialophora bantiana CBS 173.52]